MTPHHTRKLQQALIDIGHQVEKDPTAPDIEQIKDLFADFIVAANHGSMAEQKKAVDKLMSGLVKWEVERL